MITQQEAQWLFVRVFLQDIFREKIKNSVNNCFKK